MAHIVYVYRYSGIQLARGICVQFRQGLKDKQYNDNKWYSTRTYQSITMH
jgi:hypothetical protein